MADIAVIGLACRFPGHVCNLDDFWQVLKQAKQCWGEVPSDRFNEPGFLSGRQGCHARQGNRGGHFLSQNIAAFDADFFNIPPREASVMDPQQRMTLEVTYEAIENSGMTLKQAQEFKTGIYVAKFTHDYELNLNKDFADPPKAYLTGNGHAILSNRVSHCFDFRGPSMTIDTACSGSLVALHQACLSLLAGESEVAIVSGVNLILSTEYMIGLDNLRLLDERGVSYSFDSRGSGYGRGEGCAAIVLKRLDTVQKTDVIRALVKSTAVNQDGKTAGMAAPNQHSQQDLQREALLKAGLQPNDIDYVEAHGTGTVAGDVTEIAALAQAFATSQRNDPLLVGSVKSNIGHLEACSGLAGLIKAVLMLEKQAVPPNANFERPKPELDLERRRIKIATRFHRRTISRIAVNSFGFGGTNAHVLLEAPPTSQTRHATPTVYEDQPILSRQLSLQENYTDTEIRLLLPIVLTAKSRTSLANYKSRLRSWLENNNEVINLEDLSATLCRNREVYKWRSSLLVSDLTELRRILQSDAEVDVVTEVSPGNEAQLAFVFPGQGSSWAGVYGALSGLYPVFMASISQSRDYLYKCGAQWDLIQELVGLEQDAWFSSSEMAQPASVALQVGLVDLTRELGMRPRILIGHSSGEIAAAYSAGCLSHFDAIQISFHRGFVATKSQEIIGLKTSMLAVALGIDALNKFIKAYQGIFVVCYNSSKHSTLSGTATALKALQDELETHRIASKMLAVDVGYHSPYIEPATNEFASAVSNTRSEHCSPQVTVYSSVTARRQLAYGPSYWIDNLKCSVLFQHSMTNLLKDYQDQWPGNRLILVEIGAHSTLEAATRQNASDLGFKFPYAYYSFLRPQRLARMSTLEVCLQLFEAGACVDLQKIHSVVFPHPYKLLRNLPSYAWDHENLYWYESRLSQDLRFRRFPPHELLGARVPQSSTVQPTWRHTLSLKNTPWLSDHRVNGSIILPGSSYLSAVVEATCQLNKPPDAEGQCFTVVLKDVEFLRALIIPRDSDVELLIKLKVRNNSKEHRHEENTWYRFSIHAMSSTSTWNLHCNGWVLFRALPSQNQNLASLATQVESSAFTEVMEELGKQEFYDMMSESGNQYGESFACNEHVEFHRSTYSKSSIKIPDIASIMLNKAVVPHVIHPTTLDAVLQPGIALYNRVIGRDAVMPIYIEELMIMSNIAVSPGSKLLALSHAVEEEAQVLSADIDVHSENIQHEAGLGLVVRGLKLHGLGKGLTDKDESSQLNHGIYWAPDVDFLPNSALYHPLPQDTTSLAVSKLQLLNDAALVFMDLAVSLFSQQEISKPTGHLLSFLEYMKRELGKEKRRVQSLDRFVTLSLSKQLGIEGRSQDVIGHAIQSILLRAVDPLHIMTKDDLLYQLYKDDASTRCYAHARHYLEHLVFKNPHMDVLEIGGGTAEATEVLIQAFGCPQDPTLNSYTFTDISTSFFNRANVKLNQWAHVINFHKLNIEIDPKKQGFRSHCYDLIVASNVLHATENIERTLRNVRQLLRQGGRLMLVEITTCQPYLNLTFGSLPGWWLGISDDRDDGPIISQQKWHTRLLRCSFSGVDIVVDDVDGEAHVSSFIVSKATKPSKKNVALPLRLIRDTNKDYEEVIFKALHREATKREWKVAETSWLSLKTRFDDVNVIVDTTSNPILARVNAQEFEAMKALFSGVATILWITLSTESDSHLANRGLVTGFSRSAQAENSSLRFVTLDIEDQATSAHNILYATKSIVELIFMQRLAAEESYEREYVLKDGLLRIPRLKVADDVNDAMARNIKTTSQGVVYFTQTEKVLELSSNGQRQSKTPVFVERQHDVLCENEVEIHVEAISLNSSHLSAFSGFSTPSCPLLEYSGTIKAVGSYVIGLEPGDRICAWSESSISNRIQTLSSNVALIPDSISFEIGAALPADVTCALHCLSNKVSNPHESFVLIHGAAAGIGQVMLALAKHMSYRVIVTVGSEREYNLLVNDLCMPPEYILHISDPVIVKKVKRITDGKGAHVIISCVARDDSDLIGPCVRSYGTFLQLESDAYLSHNRQRKPVVPVNTAYMTFNTCEYKRALPSQANEAFQRAIYMLYVGCWPINNQITVFDISNIEEAFLAAQHPENVNKIVLQTNPLSSVKTYDIQDANLDLEPAATYVVAGGLGYLGRELCRLLACAGAKHIVILSRSKPDSEAQRRIDLQTFAATRSCAIYFMCCDVAKSAHVEEVASQILRLNLPPIKGVIQATKVLQDCTLSNMSLEGFQVPLRSKYHGTWNLAKTFDKPGESQLDFFLLLSATAGVIGSRGSANYAAGNTFMDAFANYNKQETCHYIAVDIGLTDDASQTGPAIATNLQGQGLKPVKLSDVLALLEFAMSKQAHRMDLRQIISGLDVKYRSSVTGSSLRLKNPLFNHMWPRNSLPTPNHDQTTMSFKEFIKDNTEATKTQAFALSLLINRISNMIALTSQGIEATSRPIDVGLDSLNVIQLRDWIQQEFETKLTAMDIFAQSSLSVLAQRIVQGSGLLANAQDLNASSDLRHDKGISVSSNRDGGDPRYHGGLPSQPVPDLDESLQQLLSSRKCLIPASEYERFEQVVWEFAAGPARMLQEQVLKRKQDPSVDNWQADLYADRIYLSRRDAIHPNTIFFGAHLVSPKVSHSQTRRAAIIAAAAFAFKERSRRGEIRPDDVYGDFLCTDSWKWLFNACREPRHGRDQMRRYPHNFHCAVLRRGHVFKLDLVHSNGIAASPDELNKAFDVMIDKTSCVETSLAALTSDNREEWSKRRRMLMSHSARNEALITMIESSTFVICLDDGNPCTPSQRCNQFFLGDPNNRWSDKTLQFVVCENGSSAFIGEHSALDGLSIRRLNQFMTEAIFDERVLCEADPSCTDKRIESTHNPADLVTELCLVATSDMKQRAVEIKTSFTDKVEPIEVKHFDVSIGKRAFEKRRLSPKTGFQMLIQLACRLFYGYQPCSWETVSLARFYKGRVDWIQAIQEPIKAFCDKAYRLAEDYDGLDKRKDVRECWTLLLEATIAYTKQRARIEHGLGFKAHLHTLWALAPNHADSHAFFEDEQWIASSVPAIKEVKNDSLEDLQVQEICFYMPRPECIYMHHDIHEEWRVAFPKYLTGYLLIVKRQVSFPCSDLAWIDWALV